MDNCDPPVICNRYLILGRRHTLRRRMNEVNSECLRLLFRGIGCCSPCETFDLNGGKGQVLGLMAGKA